MMTFLAWLSFLGLQACFYDAAPLARRECEATPECVAEFGAEYVCEGGYCQQTQPECAQDEQCGALEAGLGACERAACVGGRCQAAPKELGAACGDEAGCVVGACDGAGACQMRPEDARCDDGAFCNGAERCAPQEPSADARGCLGGQAPDLEDGVECTKGVCNEDADQVEQDCSTCECCGSARACEQTAAPLCFGWVCSQEYTCRVEPLPSGAPCDDGVSCTVGDACDEAQQCAGAPRDALCDDGLYCTGQERCEPGGGVGGLGCVLESVPTLDDGVPCTLDLCDEEADQVVHRQETCACQSDADCAGPCLEGACVDGACVFEPAGVGTPCDDGVGCTTDDACDTQQRCAGVPDHAGCDDGLYCTGQEQCAPGLPGADARGCAVGVPVELDDGVDCTVDACDEANDRATHDDAQCACDEDADCAATCQVGRCVEGACAFEPAGVGARCDDGVACTTNDACDAQQRCGGAPDDARCDDGAFCDGAEVCAPGGPRSDAQGCAPGAPVRLDDGVACTLDSCDEGTDQLVHEPSGCACVMDSDCARPCEQGRCVGFACVFEPAGAGAPCDDGVACTKDDVCDEALRCAGTPEDASCDNGDFCDGAEACVPSGPGRDARGCLAGSPPSLDDGVGCTLDSCDEDGDVVLHVPVACECLADEDCAATCQQGRCEGGACVFEVTPGVACDDGVGCTGEGLCDEQGACQRGALNDALCDDQEFCNGAESCSPDGAMPDERGCVAGVDPLDAYGEVEPCVVLSCVEEEARVEVDRSACCSPTEGAFLSAGCGDGLDNDCDGQADMQDRGCWPQAGQLSGLVMWLDASNQGSFSTQRNEIDQLKVTQWRDLSGQNNHANGSTVNLSVNPIYSPNERNGQAVVRFDGGADYLQVSEERNFDFTSQMTAVVVFRVGGFPGDEDFNGMLTKGDEAWRIHRSGNGAQVSFGNSYGPGGNTAHDLSSAASVNDGAYHRVYVDYASGTKRLFLDRGDPVSFTQQGSTTMNTNNDRVALGRNQDFTERYFDGYLAEVLVFNRVLSDAERTALVGYLDAHWGL